MLTPTCDRCGLTLEYTNLAQGASVIVGLQRMGILYHGDVCMECSKVECGPCRGRSVGAPCAWCGGPTKPAYEEWLKGTAGLRAGTAKSVEVELAGAWPEFRYLVGLLGGLGGLGAGKE